MEYGYYYTDLAFKEDGTGEVKYTPIDDSKKVTWTFTYTVFLAKITFEFNTCTKSDLKFTKGMIRNDGSRLEIDDASYKTMIFEAK